MLVAHTGLEPVISALRGQRVNQLHQCAKQVWIIETHRVTAQADRTEGAGALQEPSAVAPDPIDFLKFNSFLFACH